MCEALLFASFLLAFIHTYISLVWSVSLIVGIFLHFLAVAGGWIIAMELYPGFSLYRGLYEFAQYSFNGNYLGIDGMRWGDLSDSKNGMREVLIIMVVEWLMVLFVAYYVDKIISSGSTKSPLFFLQSFRKKKGSSFRVPSLQKQGSKVFVEMEKPDVIQEVRFSGFLLYIISLINYHSNSCSLLIEFTW